MRNVFIDFLKGVLICLVVYGHVIQHLIFQNRGFWDDGTFKLIYMFHMPLFMGIGGYLSFRGMAGSRFLDFARDKFLSYLVPIVVWSSLVSLGSFFLEGKGDISRLPMAIVNEAKNGLWFLWALLGCLLITAAIHSLKCKAFWFVYLISFFLVLCLPEKGNLIKLKFMYPYFQVGYAVAFFGNLEWLQANKWRIFSISLPLSFICYFLWSKEAYIYNGGMRITAQNVPVVILRYVGGFAVSVSAIVVFRIIFDFCNDRIARPFLRFGRDSVYVYILQDVLFYFVARASNGMSDVRFWGSSKAMCLAMSVMLVALCWGCGVLLASHPASAQILFGKRWRVKHRTEKRDVCRG